MFVVNGKPFINKSHISCGFLKYAWCIFKATPFRNNLPNEHITITLKKLTKRRQTCMDNRPNQWICPKIILWNRNT